MFKIPIYQPDLSGKERDYLLQCFDSSWISSKGAFIERFEQQFANFVGVNHAAAVCNGTVALHLALLALGISEGDEVIVPSFTYVASVNAIRYVGATPIFADSLPDTWQLDASAVAAAVTKRTRAVIAVHVYGGACDLRSLKNICDEHGLLLIEDCAEAFGTTLDGKHVGSFGDVATFSFFGNKTLTTGEGGMVIANDSRIDSQLRRLRGQGLAKDREYWHDIVGFNYRMTNLCAAIGVAQLERAESILKRKRELDKAYREELADVPVTFQSAGHGEISSCWMTTVLTPSAQHRDGVRLALAEQSIETRPTFNPVHLMPMYRKPGFSLRIAEDIAARGINLPSWHTLSRADLKLITATIRAFRWA